MFLLAVAFWSYSYFIWQFSNSEATALFWCRMLMRGSIFIPITFAQGPRGTGVGLSMAYRIIKDHNGNINVESEIGKGTKFIISLPIWEEKKT